jgi:hypothetical protein
LPGGPFPIESNGGFTKTQLTVFTGENGKPQATNQPEPLPNGADGDNAFVSPSGQQSSTLVMGQGVSPEPTPGFTGDQSGKWDIRISVLRTYLGLNDLVFIFDNAQEGDSASQWLQIWGQARILSADGSASLGCFELNSSSVAGCAGTSPVAPTGPFDLASQYVTVFTGYCVDKTTGAAFNLGSGTSQTCASQNGYYVNGNIGSANADNAAYSDALNDFIFAPSTDADWILSLDIRTANNNGSAETPLDLQQLQGGHPYRRSVRTRFAGAVGRCDGGWCLGVTPSHPRCLNTPHTSSPHPRFGGVFFMGLPQLPWQPAHARRFPACR